MAHPHRCLVTQKVQSTYFNVLYAYFIIGRKIRILRVFYYWTQRTVALGFLQINIKMHSRCLGYSKSKVDVF